MGRLDLDAWLGRGALRALRRHGFGPATVTHSAAPGVLSLEVSRLFFRVVQLWHALADAQICRLRDDVFCLAGVQKLVGGDSAFLSALALAETLHALGAATRAAAMLARRCSAANLRQLEHTLPDAVAAAVASGGGPALPAEWPLLAEKKMDKKAKKMERLAAATVQFFHEEEILVEMEARLQPTAPNSAVDLASRVEWQRQQVKALQEQSLWDKTYDDIVGTLATALLTVAVRVHVVFGGLETVSALNQNSLPRSYSETTRRAFSSPLLQEPRRGAAGERRHHHSGPLARTFWRRSGPAAEAEHRSSATWATWAVSRRPFRGWVKHPAAASADGNSVAAARALLYGGNSSIGISSSTLGASALALRFADIIVVIDKLWECPRLIDRRGRDELYRLLPTSVRAALRAKLRPCAKDLARRGHDPALAAEWRAAMARILEWLGPLAHGTVRWQAERQFEQQQRPSGPGVLLLQTLEFADHAKTEAAVVELLVGLNYLWRSAKEAGGGGLLQSLEEHA